MKHNYKITILLLSMFLVAQFIGLAVINAYIPQFEQITDEEGNVINITTNPIPFGLKPQEPNTERDFLTQVLLLIPGFIIAIALVLLFSKYKWKFILRLWFFIVVIIALGIAFTSIFRYFSIGYPEVIALLIALPLAFVKIYRNNFLVHNLTELLIYPGIGVVFVSVLFFETSPWLSISLVLGLLILISLYDMWAVWHSGIMQKMAQFQIQELNIFGGFFIPTASKKVKQQIKHLREKYKNKKIPKSVKNKKFKVSLAILGGGDVVFPIITAGVFLRTLGLIPALFVTAGALGGLTYLFATSKKKAYPAMPYITAGIFLGIALAWVVSVI